MIGSPRHKGVPIGNINSQYLANLILTVLDYFIKYNLGIRHVRYMDDFTMVDKDLKKILKAIPEIEKLLRDTLKLKLHPDKKYIQHFSKGVKFIGVSLSLIGLTYHLEQFITSVSRCVKLIAELVLKVIL